MRPAFSGKSSEVSSSPKFVRLSDSSKANMSVAIAQKNAKAEVLPCLSTECHKEITLTSHLLS
jgi:hypothetical protein